MGRNMTMRRHFRYDAVSFLNMRAHIYRPTPPDPLSETRFREDKITMEILTLELLCCHFYFLLSLSSARETTTISHYLGPYMEIYPYTDITRDQQSCVPDLAANQTCPLYVALMMSFGGDYVSSGVIPGVQLALNQINNDSSMLPGYTLHYTLTDTQVIIVYVHA